MAGQTAQPELVDPLEDVVGYRLRRASIAFAMVLTETFKTLDLRVAEGAVLQFIAANPGCNQAEISRALGVKRTNMVPVVGELANRGLIERDAADGRTHALRLTTEGERLHAALATAQARLEERVFGGLDGPTRARLIEVFRQVEARCCGVDD